MRGWWRLLKAFATVVACSLHTDIGARFRPPADRLSYRLQRQQAGSLAVCRALNIHVTEADFVRNLPGVLYVSNHLTAMDPILMASRLQVCFAGKAEIGRWPLLGWVCKAHAMLLVNRSRTRQTQSFVRQIRDRLSCGASVLVFPEGTTNWGHELLPFKTGAFQSVAGWDHGRVLPLFLDVAAINGEPTNGSGGRKIVSHNNHHGLLPHLLHLARLGRIDFKLYVGSVMDTSAGDRKLLAQLARERVTALCRNNTPVAK